MTNRNVSAAVFIEHLSKRFDMTTVTLLSAFLSIEEHWNLLSSIKGWS